MRNSRSKIQDPRSKSQGAKARGGFTLLEVILALGISTLVVAGAWMAIDFQLRATDTSRYRVEQAQLARAILKRIADDLRSTVRYEPIDAAALTNIPGATGGDVSSILSAAAGVTGDTSGTGTGGTSGTGGTGETGTGGTGGTGTGGTGGSGQSGSSGSGSSTGSTDPAAADPNAAAQSAAQSTMPAVIPGLYGDGYSIEIDSSRLPRLDQYDVWQQASPDAPLVDRTSDVKTVAWYVREASATGDTTGAGLVRRELDRAVTVWALDNGNSAGLEAGGELVAPEVVGLEFRYYDGSGWVDTWDSTDRQGVPVAVEIALAIGTGQATAGLDRLDDGRRTLAELDAEDAKDITIYRLIVRLPAGRPTEAGAGSQTQPMEETATEGATATNQAAQQGASGSGTGTGTGTGSGSGTGTGSGSGSGSGSGTGSGSGSKSGKGGSR